MKYGVSVTDACISWESRVRALIEEQNLEAGMKLPAERQLALQLGVSRNSLREALAKLVSEGVLVSRRGGGTFV
ncbi:GntR family transcriptional regulator, partial [Salmonella enterica]|uniref:GntR family transcriptional regulator n=1 Tax=Salmonella enterica TaxID=28901 RepID=UPI0020C4E094